MESMKPAFDILSNTIDNIEKVLNIEDPKPTGNTDNQVREDSKTNESTKPAAGQKKNKKGKKEKKPAPPALPVETTQFLQCDLRVGRVVEVAPHPESEVLYALQVRYGDMGTKSVCAGMRKFIPEDEMKDRMVVTICNLKPRKLRGIASEAMILAGSVVSGEGDKETVIPLSPPANADEGAIVLVEGMEGERTVTEGKFVSGKVWDKVVPRLLVANEIACYNGKPLVAGEGKIDCKLPDGAEIH